MTKEDALFFLARFRTKGINEKLYDALGVAIEALNAQPSAADTNVVTTDTISRQDAINAICEDGTALERQGRYSLTMAERKQRDADILEALPSAQRWIPVTPKTLPKKVGDYLVTTHSGQIARYIYMGNGSSKDYWMRCVLAWMPLPEPYKEHADAD